MPSHHLLIHVVCLHVKEAARAVQALNPVEKGVFALTRAILGNRRARLAFSVYAGALHLLVLVTLYESFSGRGHGSGTTKLDPPNFG